jgi:aminoglycoside/choline kinase family phosphotransferase
MYHSSSDSRAAELAEWLESIGHVIESIQPASSDASFRRYFRVRHANGCDVVMDAPPDKETTEPFVRIAGIMQAAGVHVPTIYQQNRQLGFLLLEDLGSTSLLDMLKPDTADGVYQVALDSLLQLQTGVDVSSCGLPVYDRALLQRELGIFYEWFLEKLLGIVVPDAIRRSLDDCLIESALQQPQICVHRDFHSRNLMWLGRAAPGVIDFQDAVVGPVTYDLVSLLRDCYISWPQHRVQLWCRNHYQRLHDAGIVEVEFARFSRWFDLMGLQRHLKAVGIFSRLHLRDNKSGYLADIPRTMDYIEAVCEQYPELATFTEFLKQQVLPVYRSTL